jgi:hypothetical protein
MKAQIGFQENIIYFQRYWADGALTYSVTCNTHDLLDAKQSD